MTKKCIDDSKKIMTAMKERFCFEFIKDLNGTRAAVRAGYSVKTAQQQSSRLLLSVVVQQRITELQNGRNERLRVDADYVLRQAVKIHERCMQEVKPKLTMKGDEVFDDDGNKVFEFNAKCAVAALTLVGKHVDIQAFRERMQIDVNVSLSDKLAAARRRVAEKGGKQ